MGIEGPIIGLIEEAPTAIQTQVATADAAPLLDVGQNNL